MKKHEIIQTKSRADKFVRSIKKRKSITNLYLMLDGECKDWFYYYQITGYFNDSYFSVDINCHKINNDVKIRIVSTTDCKTEIKDLLSEFDLIAY